MTSAPEVYGLVLAGGRSSRMGQDKALLNYRGRPQVDVCFDLLSSLCARVLVSIRKDQDARRHPVIHDRYEYPGPLNGILSAFATHPDHAWLVVACDLPFLDEATLRELLRRRDPARPATAFRSHHHEGLPEPLCAIYEPAMAARLRDFAGHGITCPRKALIRSDTLLLDLPDPLALENANRPEEFAAARAAWQATTPRPRVLSAPDKGGAPERECDACGPRTPARPLRVRFYAALREATGHAELALESTAPHARALYDELQKRFQLRWPSDRFRVAVNDELCAWDRSLQPHDTVSFIPPVAGG